MHMSRYPRVKLAHLPTPLEPMKNLSKTLGGPNIWIKRDDCTGLSSGGNKTRKLEFLMGDAIEKGADTIVTQGATQTNHGRQTAAACQVLGLECHILLERRATVDDFGEDYEKQGNVLINELYGAHLSFYEGGENMNALGQQYADDLSKQGKKAYFIPGGGSNAIGALGYVDCASELVRQADEMRLRIDHLTHGTGSSGTQAGLVAGMRCGGSNIPVMGVSVKAPHDVQLANVYKTACATAELLGLPGAILESDILVDDRFTGPGYGFPDEGTLEAIKLCARNESILLDPVYSGKGMAGLIGMIREGYYKKDENVVFLHTGGSFALFAYQELIANIK
ncbi:MAG: L-cysteate sulfo-lyase [Cellvibrionaceae bacterium]|jgi:L-cysteate sulfo-lyase